MPIKLPKGFQRRKSSGNVLDELPTVEPSFKVYERPGSSSQVLDTGAAQRRPQVPRKNSFEQEDDDLFTVARPGVANRYVLPHTAVNLRSDRNSGSGGTENSVSTALYDSGASSSRLSTSSTNPSSVDTRSDKNGPNIGQHPYNDIPVPPPHQQRSGAAGFLRNAGRTFSFGVKSQKVTAEPEISSPVQQGKNGFSFSTNRERAMTTSSVSTATPPRLLDSDLALNTSELDSFGSMFDSIGKRPSRDPSPQRPLPNQVASIYADSPSYHNGQQSNRVPAPRPLTINKTANVESSPWSLNSDTSRDGLMRSPSPSKTVTQNSPQTVVNRTLPSHSEAKQDDNMFSNSPSHNKLYNRPTRQNDHPPSSFPASYSGLSQNSSLLNTTTPHLSPPREQHEAIFDPTLLANANAARKYQEMKQQDTPTTRVMTPKEFERYKQQQNERQRMNKAFGKADSDDSGDDYDDDEDDEAERDRQAAKQRRKQEAHLAVYRQTMMKVTGEAAASNGVPSSNFGSNSMDLSNRFSTISLNPATIADEDEDEDVPLGILAAHGFPNKNRPPARLTTSGSNPNLRGLAQTQPGSASVVGESVNRGSLPAFARKLPEDPYYGAGLVNQSNRESLAFHSSPNLLSPSGAHTNHPHHPAGLVGVIAGEERARAARRGSPNATTGQYDLPQSMQQHPGMPRSQTMGQIPNMMTPGMPQMLTPGDHAQIQMSQQMTQMMQMQMQWMQQMQQFMAGGGPAPAQPLPNMENGMNMIRPQSVPMQNYNDRAQRTMSTLSPSMANWNGVGPVGNGRAGSMYAPSIAPSERSNIGLASRYRPVSTAQEPVGEMPWQKRASTMTSLSVPQWSAGAPQKEGANTTVRKVPANPDDDDDEAGWAEMKAKKEKKQKTWKLRKSGNPLQELYNGSS